MTATRKQIKDRLLALGATASFGTAINGYSTWANNGGSRRLKLWNAVDPSAQPAMFLVQHKEAYDSRGAGLPPRRWLDMGFWCYASTKADSDIGDDYLDIMEAALEVALRPDDTQRNELTLGGMVYWCKIVRDEGLFVRDPGDIDGQALLVLPVRILIP